MNANDKCASLTMEVSPEVLKTVVAGFNLEIEVLQGTTEPLSDGRLRVEITIHDEQKADMVKEFVLKCISQSHAKNNLN